jgi:hypothetical protein
MATKRLIVPVEHIPDDQPVTAKEYNNLVDAIDALTALIVKGTKFIHVNPRQTFERDNRQAKPQ